MSAGHPTDALGRVLPDPSWPPGREAPGTLELVRRFMNTTNLESGADQLGSTAGAQAWLRAEGHAIPARLTVADVDRLRRLREQLRDVVSWRDVADGDEARRDLDRLTADIGFRVRFAPVAHLDARATGTDRFIGWIVATVHEATIAGTWRRLKSCRNEHCRWVYFDQSKNASGNWCLTGACGARLKARAYRQRRKEVRT